MAPDPAGTGEEDAGAGHHRVAGGRPQPGATYRVQLHAGFGFDDAAGVTGYLADLGVTHLYCSPYFQAATGSTHGYDVVDPTRVNDELGGPLAHRRLCEALGAAGLGQILDVVPNHMAVTGRDNMWWWDVLENGPSSVYAAYFDVDWDPPESKLRNRVLLPILGDHYGRVVEAGEVRIGREGGGFVMRYFDHEAPVAPRSCDDLVGAAARRLAPDHPGRAELESIGAALGRLPPSWATDRESVRERHRDKEVLRSRLGRLAEEQPEVGAALDGEVTDLNADPDALDALLERQNYRLAWWRTAGQEMDYRRFFDINTLIGLRTEDLAVFEDGHRLVIDWLAEGVLDGIRIDHVDGLRDPAAYLERLAGSAPEAWVVVEKILETGEELPAAWPVAGTTGYDWLNLVGGLGVDPGGAAAVVAAWKRFSGVEADFADLARAAKREIMRTSLAADVQRLADLAVQVCERHRRYRDFTRRDLRVALEEIMAHFPVYRTYVQAGKGASAVDRSVVEGAIAAAAAERPDLDDELLGFLRRVLLLDLDGPAEIELALRFQQVTSPVMAKGVEDTTFYRYLPLTSLTEVGGDPARLGVGVDDFHAACREAQERRPGAMLALSTHDTKRSEDVRSRISLLSEIPDQWAGAVVRWADMAERQGRRPPALDRATEWLIYQTLVGAWPLDVDRAGAYLEKATREAKLHTSWTDPVESYDRAVQEFVADRLGDGEFVADLESFVAGLVRPGWTASLAAKLVTLTAPGVPDLYQGSELWDLSLVDPDNRRPVDYDRRRELLADLAGADPAALWEAEDGTGSTKLLVVARTLAVRRALPGCFGPGQAGRYRPLASEGSAADHVVAFSRGDTGAVAVVVPRLCLRLERDGGWRDTTVVLPPGRWRDGLSSPASDPPGEDRPGTVTGGGPVPVAGLLAHFPVALLIRSEQP